MVRLALLLEFLKTSQQAQSTKESKPIWSFFARFLTCLYPHCRLRAEVAEFLDGHPITIKEYNKAGMDPFDQSSLSPSTLFFNGLALVQQPVLHGPRKYKSRKSRPCDMCRQRQISCKIDIAPPCQFCQSHGRPCTFVERPKKKKRPNTRTSDINNLTALGELF